MRKGLVQVLLSTYNGQKYLKEQVDSLLQQDYPEVSVLVRDDGSSDGTLCVLEDYWNLQCVQVLRGENIGVTSSFFALLNLSSPHAQYIAFSDQDDVWQGDKHSRAVNMLSPYGNSLPVMYCSRVTLVDESLNMLGYSEIPTRELTFANALVQNVATGCTIVINKAARDLLLKGIPKSALVHDWWIYLVIAAFGKVMYDEESRILYRQHESNAIGEATDVGTRWLRRIRRFLRHRGIPVVTAQAAEFRELYGVMLPTDKQEILNRFLDERRTLIGRIRYALTGDTYRQSKLDDLILRLLIVLNLI